jgi:dephospho-CoA kinase
MLKKVFVINGIAGSGKDTFVSMVGAIVPTVNYSSVSKIKDAAKLLGWDGEKDDKSRKFLSDLKRLSARYNNFPFKCMVKKIIDFFDDDIHEFLFLHIREPEEIERIVRLFKIQTVLVKNDNVKQVTSNRSDAEVYEYDYDIIINNSGDLASLNKTAEKFCEQQRNRVVP